MSHPNASMYTGQMRAPLCANSRSNQQYVSLAKDMRQVWAWGCCKFTRITQWPNIEMRYKCMQTRHGFRAGPNCPVMHGQGSPATTPLTCPCRPHMRNDSGVESTHTAVRGRHACHAAQRACPERRGAAEERPGLQCRCRVSHAAQQKTTAHWDPGHCSLCLAAPRACAQSAGTATAARRGRAQLSAACVISRGPGGRAGGAPPPSSIASR